jgi:hypothetical protein
VERIVYRIVVAYFALATGRTVRGSNPGRGQFSALVPTDPGAHPASYTKGTGLFQGVRQPGRVVNNPIKRRGLRKSTGTHPLCTFLTGYCVNFAEKSKEKFRKITNKSEAVHNEILLTTVASLQTELP